MRKGGKQNNVTENGLIEKDLLSSKHIFRCTECLLEQKLVVICTSLSKMAIDWWLHWLEREGNGEMRDGFKGGRRRKDKAKPDKTQEWRKVREEMERRRLRVIRARLNVSAPDEHFSSPIYIQAITILLRPPARVCQSVSLEACRQSRLFLSLIVCALNCSSISARAWPLKISTAWLLSKTWFCNEA